jgi:SNF2 family DNA or RNA helicase
MAGPKKAHVYPVPSNYDQLKKVRASSSVELKPNPFVKSSVKLRPYQTVGALNMLLLKYFILGDDPGLGKTLQTLVAFAIAKSFNPNLQMIVFTMKSAKKQWAREVTKFTDGISCHVLSNSYRSKVQKKTLTGFASRQAQYEEQIGTDIFVCGYYPLMTEPYKLREARGENLMVVFDECQMLKNPKSKTHVGAEAFIERVSMIYGLTATPIKNRLVEFYYIFRIVMPKLMPKITHFKDEFCIQELKFVPQKGGEPRMMKEVTGYKNLDHFREVIAPYFFRRSADDVGAELPSIISRRIEFNMTPSQQKLYSEALAGVVYERKVRQRYLELKEKVEGIEASGQEVPTKVQEMFDSLNEKYQDILAGDFLKKNKNSALAFCQLIANGPKWLGPDEEGDSGKEEAFDDLFEGELSGQKVIVYTRFKSGIHRLEAILAKKGIKSVRVSGDENDKQREKAMEVFQDPDSDVDVIFITDAGSAAINLQISGILMLYDSPWTWGDLVQIIGRARRIGSVHEFVRVYHMVALNTIDQRVLSVLFGKKDLVNQAVGQQAKGILEFEGEEALTPLGKGDPRSEVEILFEEVFG